MFHIYIYMFPNQCATFKYSNCFIILLWKTSNETTATISVLRSRLLATYPKIERGWLLRQTHAESLQVSLRETMHGCEFAAAGCHGDGCHGDLHNGLEVRAKQVRLVALDLTVLHSRVIEECVQLDRFICGASVLVLPLRVTRD